MNVNKFVDFVVKIGIYRNNNFEDLDDNLNCKLTGLYLSTCFLGILLRQFLMKPITCFISVETGALNLLEYMEYYCYVTGTVAYDFNSTFPNIERDWAKLNKQKSSYYQWIIFILAFQMFCFYLPQYLWKYYYTNMTGRDLRPAIKLGHRAAKYEGADREEILKELTSFMKKTISYNHENNLFKKFHIKIPRYFTVYIFTKILHVLNTLGQVYFLTYLLNKSLEKKSIYNFGFGMQIVMNLLRGDNWHISTVFPRVGFCFAEVAHLGAINHVTAQCALPLNMLIEKMFIISWFWFLFLTIITIITTTKWFIEMLTRQQHDYISKHIRYIHKTTVYNEVNDATFRNRREWDKNKQKMLPHFTDHYLHLDGVFILKMIGRNCGEILVAELIDQLLIKWMSTDQYRDKINKIVKLDKTKSTKCQKSSVDCEVLLVNDENIPKPTNV